MLRTCLVAVAVAISAQALADETYPTNQCIERLDQDPRLAPIADKVALGRSDQTSAEMFDLERPAVAPERNALELWSKLRQFCFDLCAEFRGALANSQQVSLAGRLFGLHQRMLHELLEGRTTYAEFNRRRVEVYLIAATLESQMMEGEQAATPDAPLVPAGQTGI